MGPEEPRVFPGTISVRQGVAGKKKVFLGGPWSGDDTRRDPPLWKALAEADFADSGRQGGEDTRQDHP